MMRLIQSPWMANAVGILACLVTLVVAWPRATVPGPQAVETRRSGLVMDNPEADQMLAEIKREREQLAARANELQQFATRLQAERAELNQLTQRVQQVQDEFDRHVSRITQEETSNLKRLAKTYSTMSPQAAAIIFAELQDEHVAKVVAFMKEAEAAAVLEALSRKGETEAKRVAALSEKLRLTLMPQAPK